MNSLPLRRLPPIVSSMCSSLHPLTDGQIEEYFREGYIVARNLVPPASIDRVLAKAATLNFAPGLNWKSKRHGTAEGVSEESAGVKRFTFGFRPRVHDVRATDTG